MSNKSDDILPGLAVEIIEKSSDGVVIIDASGKVAYANAATRKMFGLDITNTEVIKEALPMLVPDAEEQKQHIESWQKDLLQEFPGEHVLPLTSNNGDRHWYCYHVSHMINGYHLINIRDVSEQQLIEFQYRATFEKAPDAIVLVDAETTKIIEFNEKACSMLGYSREEYAKLSIIDIEASENPTQIKQHMKNMFECGHDSFETTLRCKNGDIRHVHVIAITIQVAGRKLIQSIQHDLTDRKKTELALVESEEMFRNLADQSPNMIFINQNRKVVYVNHLCETVMGYSRKEFYSPEFNFMCLIAPESYPVIEKSWGKHIKQEEASPYECEIVTKNGKRIPTVIATKLIRYEGKPAILGIVTDISALKEIENKLNRNSILLREQKKELQQKNTALKEILTQIETEKLHFKKQASTNIERLVLPALKKIRGKMDSPDTRYIDILESNIKEIFSSFGIKLSSGPTSLSPREIEICNMIKSGLSSKEIAKLLRVSLRTVETHRNRIRKKLRISTRDVNLSSHLQNLT